MARVEREYDLLEEQVGWRRGQRKLCIAQPCLSFRVT